MATARVTPSPAETTDLERRVLAHERVLQSLIAYMSRAEPRFIDHLRDRFVEPMKMARREHDYRDVDDYAEEFIRAIMLVGDTSKPAASGERAARHHLNGADCVSRAAEPPQTAIRQNQAGGDGRRLARHGGWRILGRFSQEGAGARGHGAGEAFSSLKSDNSDRPLNDSKVSPRTSALQRLHRSRRFFRRRRRGVDHVQYHA